MKTCTLALSAALALLSGCAIFTEPDPFGCGSVIDPGKKAACQRDPHAYWFKKGTTVVDADKMLPLVNAEWADSTVCDLPRYRAAECWDPFRRVIIIRKEFMDDRAQVAHWLGHGGCHAIYFDHSMYRHDTKEPWCIPSAQMQPHVDRWMSALYPQQATR